MGYALTSTYFYGIVIKTFMEENLNFLTQENYCEEIYDFEHYLEQNQIFNRGKSLSEFFICLDYIFREDGKEKDANIVLSELQNYFGKVLPCELRSKGYSPNEVTSQIRELHQTWRRMQEPVEVFDYSDEKQKQKMMRAIRYQNRIKYQLA